MPLLGSGEVEFLFLHAPVPPAVISVVGLSKTYATGFEALKNIDLTIRRGEIFALLGPNGAGKTTLISLISGTLLPTAGEIHFEGRRIDGLPAFKRARLGIGRTFQVMKPFPGLSVLENVTVGALFGANMRRFRL